MNKGRVLSNTKSLCPRCLKLVEASYVEYNDKIYMQKNCKEHGGFSVLVWENIEHWYTWQHHLEHNTPENCRSKVEKGCPYDCGLCEKHRQKTCCVLFEVTRRCNLSCPVCFASSGMHSDKKLDPTIEKINSWYDLLLQQGGPFNIQLSGGEPTLRDDLPEIITIGKRKGFNFFQLNTNGIRLAEDFHYLKSLVDAGLNTVFLQFDGFSEKSCIDLRGKNCIDLKLEAINNCEKVEVGIVLVPTIKAGSNLDQVGYILEFASKKMPAIRGVHFQPMSFFGRFGEVPEDNSRVTIPALLCAIEEQTNGKMKASHFSPGNAEHYLCSFHGDYTIEKDNWKHIKNKNNQTCCVSSAQARHVVARKWSAPLKLTENECCNDSNYNTDSIDKFLQERTIKTLAISGMAFQDAWNLDLNRLKQCYIHVVSQEGCLIPFCAYNLNGTDGQTLYRGKDYV